MTTLLIAEHEHEVLKDSTNKALTAASQLGGDVHVLVAGGGPGTKTAADTAAKLAGVAKVLVAEGDLYAHDLAEPLAALIVSLAPSYDAFVASRDLALQERDAARRRAARRHAGLGDHQGGRPRHL
ncbi:electron transfer flavoprotein alpha subunit [Bradyrhizobium sp. LM6.10]